MTNILPIVFPALPTTPVVASLATVDASMLLLPFVLVVAITVGILLERAQLGRGRSRQRRALQIVPMRRAA
jgi:hypothetical protein